MTHPDAQRAFDEMMPEPVACAYLTAASGEVALTSLFDRTYKALKAAERVRLGIATSSIDLYTADQMRQMFDAATERAAKECLALKPPDLNHAPGDYHRFDITTAACAAAIRGTK